MVNNLKANFFAGNSEEETQKQIEEKKLKIKEIGIESDGKKNVLRSKTTRNAGFKKNILDRKLNQEVFLESSKKFNKDLMRVQDRYNTIVDPFNNSRKLTLTNKENYQVLARIFGERCKEIEGIKTHQRKEIESMNDKIKSTQDKIDEKQQQLNLIKEVFENCEEALEKVREKRQTAAMEFTSINFDELKQSMENAKMMQEQEKFEIEELHNMRTETEEAIRQLSEENSSGFEHLSALEYEVSEGIAAKQIEEERLISEKNIFDKLLQTQFDRHCERVMSANLNIAKEMRDVLETLEEFKKENEELNKAVEENNKEIDMLTEENAETIRSNEKIEEELASTSNGNEELLERKDKLLKSISDLKKEKENMLQEFEEATNNYNALIEKEQRKQTKAGVVDDEKSTGASDEMVSEISSLASEKHVQAEKIDFKVSPKNSSDKKYQPK